MVCFGSLFQPSALLSLWGSQTPVVTVELLKGAVHFFYIYIISSGLRQKEERHFRFRLPGSCGHRKQLLPRGQRLTLSNAAMSLFWETCPQLNRLFSPLPCCLTWQEGGGSSNIFIWNAFLFVCFPEKPCAEFVRVIFPFHPRLLWEHWLSCDGERHRMWHSGQTCTRDFIFLLSGSPGARSIMTIPSSVTLILAQCPVRAGSFV